MSFVAPRNEMPRPFLKWAGGKTQLLGDLARKVEAAGDFGDYHEPFVGGGALFFHLHREGLFEGRQAFLSDDNPRLIEAWHGVQQDVEQLIALLKEHAARHSKEYYYEVRAQVPETTIARAARILYLNRTCFNGLYRENSKGLFNVPIGSYTDPEIYNEANLRAVNQALQGVAVKRADFAAVLDGAKPGDLVYFDPPYQPLSRSSSFTAYHNGGFGEDQQRRLAEVYAALDRKGVKVLLSNSMAPLVEELYSDFKIDEVLATRAVNSRASGRGKIAEALVANF